MRSLDHFRSLDSLRGVCALLVLLYHFPANSHIYNLWFVRGSWLFVDFFFVLSGFVIAANYQDRLLSGFSVKRFMWLRFGRLYPLHLFVLMLMIAVELAKAAMGGASGAFNQEPFSGDKPLHALPFSLALLQSVEWSPFPYWNGPAWSISAEFWTYLFFALICAIGLRSIYIAELLIFVAVPAWILIFKDGSLFLLSDGGLFRCLLGFAVGVGCWQLWKMRRLGPTLAGRLEMPAALLVVVFVALAEGMQITLAAPLVFGCVVYVFAADAGPISRAVHHWFWVMVGLLSYSIYMIHVFVIMRVENICRLLERKFGISEFGRTGTAGGTQPDLIGTTPWVGDVLLIATLAIVIGISWCTYHWIERPGRDWFRARASRQTA